ncbi:membrane protein [Sulfurospirillum deleyianum DSM 6946]|uniref:Membrane protein n=2 Tax=Sulfurospirillum deleyianum TaxID=65553 RepID=D1B183_SULD5|nr:membrane protein [Sulfurospirillum deleyianum DSM 6946]
MRFSRTTAEEVKTQIQTNEAEKLSLQAHGEITTQEGKSIALSLETHLSRYDSYRVEIRQSLAQMVDPLVMNLQGGLVNVEKEKTFSFDLNSDGVEDTLSLLAQNSGFLALDRDENGLIDDGSELFGTQSGDGFLDLSAYDDDANGWIDANDEIFSKLKIWQKSALEDKLISLSEAKVGALLLESVESAFSYKNDETLNAALKKSSVVLFEDGKTGWMSHLDFSITPPASTQNQTTLQQSSEEQSRISLEPSSLSKLKASSTQESDSLVDGLKKRLKVLQARLPKAENEGEKNALMVQILELSLRIVQLGG